MLAIAGLSLSLLVAAPMNQAMEALSTLQPLLAKPEAFGAPENRPAVTQALETLARLEHPFVRGQGMPSSDVALIFGRVATAARLDYARGRDEPARYRARTFSQLCIACHVLEPTKAFADAEKVAEKLGLAPLQRAQFYATTRQVDRALALWKVELAKPVTLEPELFEQLDALRLALRVIVPVTDDPREVRALLVPQLNRRELPDFLRVQLTAWDKDTRAWAAERFSGSGRSAPELLARARGLIAAAKAESTVAAQPMEFVKLLRATSYLDEVLRREPASAARAEVLYLLGVAAATTTDVPLWELEGMFLEACIRENAHQPRAATCARRLKSRTYFVWSANRDIPAETWNALSELMALSLPKR